MAGRYFIGVILILLGICFTLDQTGTIELSKSIGTYWPLIIITVGIYQLLKRSVSIFTGLIITAIGIVLQINALGYLPKDFLSYVWPTIIILIGITLLTSKTSTRTATGVHEDSINYFAAFSGLENRVISENFQGGSVTALFGGAEIDLRDSGLAEGASLDLIAIFGGVGIRVPRNWKVVVSGLPLFGGWENKTSHDGEASENQPILKVRCTAIFGGVEIKD